MSSHPNHNPGFLKLVNEAKKRIRQLSIRDVVEKFNSGSKFYFLDTREESEWKEGHARGATHLSRGVLERDIETQIPNKDAEIVLYCGGGYRSALAADSLMQMGYRNVSSMDGGWREWIHHELPIEK